MGRRAAVSVLDESNLSRAAASDAIGGVKQQGPVFNQIIGVTLVIAVVVVALFFALLTVERAGLYGVLKAIGAARARSSEVSWRRPRRHLPVPRSVRRRGARLPRSDEGHRRERRHPRMTRSHREPGRSPR